jgi:uncharacterized protein YegL
MKWLLAVWAAGRLLRHRSPDLTVEEAKRALPQAAKEAFTAAVASKDEASVLSSMAELSELYGNAQAELDSATIQCKNHKERFKKDLETARLSWQEMQNQVSSTMSRMASAQSGVARAETEIETYRNRHASLTQTCGGKQAEANTLLGRLEEDMPIAAQLVEMATAGCAGGGEAAAMLSCSVDGHTYTTFADDALRDLVSTLSVPSEQFMSLALTRSHAASEEASLLQARHTVQKRKMHKKKEAECTEVASPSCGAFADIMFTFRGNVIDAADELKERMAAAEQHCARALDEFSSEVAAGKLRADALNTELANAAAAKADLQDEEQNKKRFYEAQKREAETVVDSCEKTKKEAAFTVAAVKKLKAVLVNTGHELPPFEGDCEVSEWIREPCSKQCERGTQYIKREIISLPEGGICPPLNRTEECNLQPCPVECRMTPFGDWTLCSRSCGGGTRQRTRAVEQHPQHGGAPCGDVLQQEVCNPQPCQTDCTLATWSAWSTCSRSCGGGTLTRTRNVVRPPTGGGKCPAAMTAERLENKECNMVACAESASCKSRIDWIILVDGSGSTGDTGLAAEQAFLRSLATRLGDEAQVGVVVFGGEATVAAPLGAPSALASLTLEADLNTTNLAKGLAVARDQLIAGRSDAHPTILVLTDGMPLSKHLAGVEIARAKETATVSFAVVGDGVNPHAVKEWVSHPYHEHIVQLQSYDDLAPSLVPILGTACAVLE